MESKSTEGKKMSKSSELDKVVKAYIIENIDATGYDVAEPTTDAEKVQFLKETFYNEYGYEVARSGEVNALREWIAGLPSSLSVAYSNFDVLELARQWGSLDKNASEREEDKILDNWFNLIANKTAQLFRKYC